MVKDLGHGERLTADEYERRIIELHRNLPPMPSREMDREIRRKELNLAIDHRIGVDFPVGRREQLWSVMQRVERRRLWLAFKYLLRRLVAPSLVPGSIHSKAERLAGFMVDEFAETLNEQELRSFFDLERGERPKLPLGS
jgi:hypothetical protein